VNRTHQFEVKFRSRKNRQEAILVRGGRFYHAGRFYTTYLPELLRSAEPLPATVDYDMKLVRTRLGHYYLCIPAQLEVASDSQARHLDRVVALDPGVRTFHSAYDPSGSVF
jgi:hypothetical protein